MSEFENSTDEELILQKEYKRTSIPCNSIGFWLESSLKLLEDVKTCRNGNVNIGWIIDPNTDINTQKRSYQREKVAPVEFKQEIMRTVLVAEIAGIPEVHIRIRYWYDHSGNLRYQFELIDGQQRITSITDYLAPIINPESTGFPLGKEMKVDDGYGNIVDISGMTAVEVNDKYPKIIQRIFDYCITCKWYVGISDQETAYNFIHVLNNVNNMTAQEIRNAILGVYSDFVRDTARGDEKQVHKLFHRIIDADGKEKLKYFSPKFTLKGRMEVDEWLSELIYLQLNGVEKGITPKSHFNWVESQQTPIGKYSSAFTDKAKIKKLLSFAFTVIKAVPAKWKSRLNPMTSLMLVLYGYNLKQKSGSLIESVYVDAFFKVWDKWTHTNAHKKHKMVVSGTPMPPFNEMFGGKNPNAIKSIFFVLNLEKDNGRDFGAREVDDSNFSKDEISRRWRHQNGKCYYFPHIDIDEEDAVGDHLKARSRGGKTVYENLVVTSFDVNAKKLNSGEDEFKEWCRLKPEVSIYEEAETS